MDLPVNHFKRALKRLVPQIGIWSTYANPNTAETLAGAGFDWILLDAEHSPNNVPLMMQQLQAVSSYPISPVVRPPWNDPVLIKQYLDIGAQTLLLPYVQNAVEAQAAVRAMRYPPRGIRGVGGSVRATRYGRVPDYFARAEEELCLLVQVETVEALAEIEAIADVDGVDGIFIGPADLSASMGHLGNPGHPDVCAAIDDAIKRIGKCGKAAGILMVDEARAHQHLSDGALFVAVGVDAGILARESGKLAARFKTAG